MAKAFACIVCGKELEPAGEHNQPANGIAFQTHGHYGSTVFDPMNGTRLEINVCDSCIVEKTEEGKVGFAPKGAREVKPWKPGMEDVPEMPAR